MLAMVNGRNIYIYICIKTIYKIPKFITYTNVFFNALENLIDDMSKSGESLKAKAN